MHGQKAGRRAADELTNRLAPQYRAAHGGSGGGLFIESVEPGGRAGQIWDDGLMVFPTAQAMYDYLWDAPGAKPGPVTPVPESSDGGYPSTGADLDAWAAVIRAAMAA